VLRHLENWNENLVEKTVSLNQIYLDPWNPRFPERLDISEGQITEKKTQEWAMEQMQRFDVDKLMRSIKKNGFLKIDKIVARPIKNKAEEYMVLEGNRRVAALRSLIESPEELEDHVKKSIENFEVLVYTGEHEDSAWFFQGLRSLSGIKEWRPYQKAKFIADLVENTDMSYREVAETYGVGQREALWMLRAYYALKNMEEDEEYGDYAKPKLFSYFHDAAVKKRTIREWLGGWSDEDRKFGNEDNLERFYNWIVPGEDERPKAIAEEIRDNVSKLIAVEGTHPDILRRWEDGLITLSQALSEVERAAPPVLDERIRKIESLKDNLREFPVVARSELSREQRERLRSLLKEIMKSCKDLLYTIK